MIETLQIKRGLPRFTSLLRVTGLNGSSLVRCVACVVSDVVIGDEVGEYIPVGATVKGW